MAGRSERGAGGFSLARVFARDYEVLSSLTVKSVMLQTFLLFKRQDGQSDQDKQDLAAVNCFRMCLCSLSIPGLMYGGLQLFILSLISPFHKWSVMQLKEETEALKKDNSKKEYRINILVQSVRELQGKAAS